MKRQETIALTAALSLLLFGVAGVGSSFAGNVEKAAKAGKAQTKVKVSEAQKKLAVRMAGYYTGSCQIGNRNSIKMKTQIQQDASGLLKGDYTMSVKEPNEHEEQGTLEQVGELKGNTVTFAWKDMYGKGTLEATFTSDFSKFDGTWGAATSERTWSWTGERDKEEPTAMD